MLRPQDSERREKSSRGSGWGRTTQDTGCFLVHDATSEQTQVVVFHQAGFDKLADGGKVVRWRGGKVVTNWLVAAGNRLEKHLQKDLAAAAVL